MDIAAEYEGITGLLQGGTRFFLVVGHLGMITGMTAEVYGPGCAQPMNTGIVAAKHAGSVLRRIPETGLDTFNNDLKDLMQLP